jgi:hypothetical protein
VTAAERTAARGHSAFAICLGPGKQGQQDLAYALERLLFDHGCVVQVIENHTPETLRLSVRTAYDAGLVLIVVGADRAIVQDALPPGSVVAIEPGQPNLGVAETARKIWTELEAGGRLGGSQSPLTGGAGI